MPTLDFRGRSFIARHHEVLPHHTLLPRVDLSVLPPATEPSLDNNLIIEGDNLLALESLLPYYRGRVKCIYIDPPYNTGNEHWVYNDNVSGALFKEWLGQEVGPQGEDFNRHDKWCCTMFPRLQLLRELLREDGVIFVSIDDNEVHHLRMLMDEIFGEGNFIAEIVWKKRSTPPNDKIIGANHEYVIVYCREQTMCSLFLKTRNEQQTARYTNPDNHPKGVWAAGDLTANVKGGRYVASLYFPIINPKTGEEHYPGTNGNWCFNKDKITKLLENDEIFWGEGSGGKPKLKRFLSEVKAGVTWGSIWDDAPLNQAGTAEMTQIFEDGAAFENPKPVGLLSKLMQLGSTNSDIVLDSFAGSGTTAHAVLQLNKEDGGNRKFILVQMPYDNKDDERAGKNIARDITRERVKRVIEGVDRTIPALGGSFTYATLSDDPLTGYYGILRPDTPWAELAGYVWQTEARTAFDPAQADEATGRVGQIGDLAVYLLYVPDEDASRAFDAGTLAHLENEPARAVLVYAEKHWVDADVLRQWQTAHHKSVTVRLLPTQLR